MQIKTLKPEAYINCNDCHFAKQLTDESTNKKSSALYCSRYEMTMQYPDDVLCAVQFLEIERNED